MVSVTILADSEHRDFGGVCNHFVDVPFMTDSEHLDRWDYLDNDGGRNQLAQAAGIHNYDGGHNDNDSGRNQSAQAAGSGYGGGYDGGLRRSAQKFNKKQSHRENARDS